MNSPRSAVGRLGQGLLDSPPRRSYGAVGLVAALVAGVAFYLRVHSEWEATFLAAAQHLHRGAPIYGSGTNGFVYPPFSPWLLIPVSMLPHPIERIGWYALNVVALLFMVRLCWRLAGGPDFSAPRWSGAEHLSFLIGLGVALPYILNCLSHQQIDLAIDALAIAGCSTIASGRLRSGASWLGLASALKGPELLWSLFFVRRRRLAAAVWLAALALGLNLLPELCYPSPASFRITQWVRDYVLIGLRKDYYPGLFSSALYYNQSLSGMAGRWSLTHLSRGASGLDVISNPPRISRAAIDAILYPLMASLTVVTLALQDSGGRKSESDSALSPRRVALECAAMVCLILLLAPMSSPAHFGILLLPSFCAARLAWSGGQRRFAGWTIAALALALMQSALAGPLLRDLARWCGTTTLATLILLAICELELLARLRRELRGRPWGAG